MNLDTGPVAMIPIRVEDGVVWQAAAVPVPLPVPFLVPGQKPHVTS